MTFVVDCWMTRALVTGKGKGWIVIGESYWKNLGKESEPNYLRMGCLHY